jgi:hypothetical protein
MTAFAFVFDNLCKEWGGVDVCPEKIISGFPHIQRAIFELPLMSSAFSGAIISAMIPRRFLASVFCMIAFGTIGLASTIGFARYFLEGIDSENYHLSRVRDYHSAFSAFAQGRSEFISFRLFTEIEDKDVVPVVAHLV